MLLRSRTKYVIAGPNDRWRADASFKALKSFIGRTDAEAEAPKLCPPDAKSWLIEKDPDAGRGWGQEEKGATEDEMVEWHHWLDGHEFE